MSIQNAKFVSTDTDQTKYFATDMRRGDKLFPVSASMLKAFDVCPRRWMDGWTPPDSDAKKMGSLLDARLLTPQQFNDRFAVQPSTYQTTGMKCCVCDSITDSKKCSTCKTVRIEVPIEKDWSKMSDTCKEWVAKQAAAGKTVVDNYELGECDAAIKRILQDDVLSAFIESSQKQVYLSAEWRDKASGLTVPIRILIDLRPGIKSEFASCLGDLKRTRNAGLREWKNDVYKFGHYLQAALYLDVYNSAFPDETRDTWCFVLQEAFAPYQPAKRILSQSFLDLGRSEYKRIIANYCHCLKTGKWPDYDTTAGAETQGWAVVEADEWMASKGQNSPRFAELKTAATPTEPAGFDVVP